MNDLSFNVMVDKLLRVNIFQSIVTHRSLGEVGKSVQSLFVVFIVLVLDGETLGVGHALCVDELDFDFAELLVILCVINAEHISPFGNQSETARHGDSCHCFCPP